jgi:hypothetical protein
MLCCREEVTDLCENEVRCFIFRALRNPRSLAAFSSKKSPRAQAQWQHADKSYFAAEQRIYSSNADEIPYAGRPERSIVAFHSIFSATASDYISVHGGNVRSRPAGFREAADGVWHRLFR